MATYLRHGVYMCLVDEGAIFLDICANAYIGIDAPTKDALRKHLAGLDPASEGRSVSLDCKLPQAVAELQRRGLLTDSRSAGRSFSPLILPITHCVPFGTGRSQPTRAGVIDLVTILVAFTCAWAALRRGHLLTSINRLITLKARMSSAQHTVDWQKILDVVHTFRRLSTLLYTPKNACLLDSVVLTEFLIRRGHQPTLVLGVHTKPFFAHAWVQIDDCVLNDSLERAQVLTPIAAI